MTDDILYNLMCHSIYVPNGRTKYAFDCYGLVKYVYKLEHNIDIVDFNYTDPNDSSNEKYYYNSLQNPTWKKVAATKGSIVGLLVNGHIGHCGYMVSDTEFIHIMKGCGIVRVKITNPKWRNRIVGYYKYGSLK